MKNLTLKHFKAKYLKLTSFFFFRFTQFQISKNWGKILSKVIKIGIQLLNDLIFVKCWKQIQSIKAYNDEYRVNLLTVIEISIVCKVFWLIRSSGYLCSKFSFIITMKSYKIIPIVGLFCFFLKSIFSFFYGNF